MADAKISQLPAATTPLTGAELVPVVQSGVTAQVSVSNLTAGRALSATTVTAGTITATTANLTNVAATTVTENGYPVVSQTDIGTAPNEIPLNQYLGTLAFQNAEAVVIRPQASEAPAGIGDMVFQLTNDTTLVIKVKGSDGTVRAVTLTLA